MQMLQKIKSLLNTDLTKVFSLNALATLVKMLTGFVSVKVVAVLIGPAGIALLGQLNNFSTIFLTLSTGGIYSGITKYIAENAGSQKKINIFLRTSVWITVVLSCACALILIIGSGYFSRIILKDDSYQSIMVVFGLTIIMYSLNGLASAIINGYKLFKDYVKINIGSSIVGLLFVVAFANFYGLYGALLATVTYQSVVFIITVLVCARHPWFKKVNLLGRFNFLASKRLAQFSLMALVSAATVPVSQLIVRGLLTTHTSIHDAGIWEGMNRISGMYLMVITSSLAVYYLPRLAEIKTKAELRNEIFSIYKFVLPFLFISTTLIYLFRHLVIRILFNDDFIGMEHFFIYQLAGDFFKIGSWLLAYQMLAKSMTRMFILTEILFSVSLIIFSMLFIATKGAVGASMAYCINYLLYWILMLVIFRKTLFY